MVTADVRADMLVEDEFFWVSTIQRVKRYLEL